MFFGILINYFIVELITPNNVETTRSAGNYQFTPSAVFIIYYIPDTFIDSFIVII